MADTVRKGRLMSIEEPTGERRYVLLAHTVTGMEMDDWCRALSKGGVFVDWHSYAGRHAVFLHGSERDRERVLGAIIDSLDDYRLWYRRALEGLGLPCGERMTGSCCAVLTSDGILVDNMQFLEDPSSQPVETD